MKGDGPHVESRPGDARRPRSGRARPDESTGARDHAGGRRRQEQPRRARPRPDQPRSEQPRSEQSRSDQPRPERPRSERPHPDQPRRRRPRPGEQGPGQPRPEQLGPDQQRARPPRRPAPSGDRAPQDRRRPRADGQHAPPRRRRPAPQSTTTERRATSDEIHTRDRGSGETPPKRRRARPADPSGRPAAALDNGGRRRPSAPSGEAAPRTRRSTGSAPPTGRPATSRPGWRAKTTRAGVGRGLIAFLSISVLLCTGYAWNNVNNLNSNITQLGGLGLGGADDGAVDILLVGTDSRTDAKGNPLSQEELDLLRSGEEIATNTDTILLIRIPNDGSSATAISIPRDSYVEVPGIGMSKINAAYGTTKEGVRQRAVEAGQSEATAEKEGTQAGRGALIESVAGLTGVEVDHYAEVGLLGFVLLTNAVDGVDVCLKEAVREPLSGARFRAGEQTLNGPKALSFVRQRHGLPRGDLDRITRQQVFMASLANKMLSANMLADPGKLSELQRAVSRSVVIDDNWDVVKLAEQLKDLSGGRVKFATIPVVTEQGWSEDGQQSVVEVDPRQVRSFTDDLLNSKKDADAVERADYTVDVVNAGTVDGLGANVANILTTKGFQSGETASGQADDRDTVVYAHAEDAGARQLAQDLGGAEVRVDSSLPDKRLKAVLTNTYGGPGSILDTGAQVDNVPASERVGNNRPPITAGTDGPTCVN
ncbi:LCP family protein [Gordonia sp. PKS22-38]|uniref:LCP family protein n=1 Tax=Gordonia prachuapensis TaxID=3115651 RepID=A0ABU7MQW0_9ACTN|nr:LCP family protein [Gordonia sp. PKS22-38]